MKISFNKIVLLKTNDFFISMDGLLSFISEEAINKLPQKITTGASFPDLGNIRDRTCAFTNMGLGSSINCICILLFTV